LNILIVKLSGIGDVVMSLPFLAALRRTYPEARLTWLVEEAAADIVLDHPLLDRVLVSRRKSWIRDIKQGSFKPAWQDFRALLTELRRERYDLVIDLQGLFKSGIFTFLSGSKRRVGFDRSRELSHLFFNERLEPFDPDRRALLRYLDVAGHLGADLDHGVDEYFKSGLPVNENAARKVEQLLAGMKRPMVTLIPAGGSWPTKLWPVEYWAALIQRLTSELDAAVVLAGGAGDMDYNQEITRAVDRNNTRGWLDVTDMAGLVSLKVLAEVFRRADLVLGPDTGPLHLAAAAGAPVAALFGPTAPWRTGPFGDNHVILRQDLECSPCFQKTCPDPKCMTDLSVDIVFEAIKKKIS